MTSFKTCSVYLVLFSVISICAPSLVMAQQAGGELSLQGASLGPVAPGYDINREANI